jgi:cytosine deaminase
MSASWWLRAVCRPTDAAPVDVRIEDGRITQVVPAGSASPAPGDVDGRSGLLLPGLIDSHCHVDKTLWGGPWIPHTAGPSVAARIAEEQRRRSEVGVPSVDRTLALLEQMVVSGTTHIRTHTDVDPDLGLSGFEAVIESTNRMDGRIAVEQVAFPQSGILARPGTAALLEEAVKQGAAAIGGLDPAGFDNDPVRHLDIVFDIAGRHGCQVDIHLHDPGELGRWELRLIAERTRALGLQGRVTLSHVFCLSSMTPAEEAALLEDLASAGISLTTAAVFNRPVPPVAALREAGVNLSAGNDGIRDLWSPFGNGDMLERAAQVACRADLRRDEDIAMALDTATTNAAVTLHLPDYGLEPGCAAHLVVVPARNVAEAVVTRPTRALVVKDGRITARNGQLEEAVR